MITVPQIMPLLLDSCSGFRPAWEEHLAWWKVNALTKIAGFEKLFIEK